MKKIYLLSNGKKKSISAQYEQAFLQWVSDQGMTAELISEVQGNQQDSTKDTNVESSNQVSNQETDLSQNNQQENTDSNSEDGSSDSNIVSKNGWDYKKEGDSYYAKKVGTDEWKLSKGDAAQSIAFNIYGEGEPLTPKESEEEQVFEEQDPSMAHIKRGLSSKDQEAVAALTEDDDLDLRNLKTVVNKGERAVQTAFLQSSDYPGLNVEATGFAFGHSSTFTLPDGQSVYVDLGTDKALAGLTKVKQWYEKNQKENPAKLSIFDQIGRRVLVGDSIPFFDIDDLESINASIGVDGAGYEIEDTKRLNYYNLKKDGQIVAVGPPDQIQKYLWENIDSDEVKAISEFNLKQVQPIIKEVEAIKNKKYEELTNAEVESDLFNSGQVLEYLTFDAKNAGVSDEALQTIAVWLSTPYYGSTRVKTSDGFQDKRYEKQGWRQEKYGSILEHIKGAISDDDYARLEKVINSGSVLSQTRINAEKKTQADNYGSAWLQQEYRDHNLHTSIRAGVDLAIENVEQDFEDKIKGFETEQKRLGILAERRINNAIAIRDNLFNEIKEAGFGWETTGEGDNTRIKIKGQDKDKVKKYQKRVNDYFNSINTIQSEYEKELNELSGRQRAWFNNGDTVKKYGQLKSFSQNINKEFDTSAVLAHDIAAGFENLFVGIPAAFGSEAAMDRLEKVEKESEGFETMLDYRTASQLGVKGRFSLRTTAQQSANVVTAIGLSALGAPPALLPTMFGLSSAGGTRTQLRTTVDNAEKAKITLNQLEASYKNGEISYEDYRSSKISLNKQIAAGDLERWQIEAAVWGTGIIEGGVTYFLGTVPNAAKVVKDLKGTGSTVAELMTRSNWGAARSATMEFGKRVGSEILEEEIIYFGSELTQGLALGREMDFSGWDDTMVSSLLVAGPMNGPSILYSTITSQIASAPLRQRYSEMKSTLKDLDAVIAAAETPLEKQQAQAEYAKVLSEFGDIQSGMELDARLIGADGIKTIMENNITLNELYVEAGVDPRDTPAQKEKKIQDYKQALESEGKTDKLKAFEHKLDNANKAIQEVKDKSNLKLADNLLLEGLPLVESLFGKKGVKKLQELEKDPEFAALTSREKLGKLQDNMKRNFRNSIVRQAKRTPAFKNFVEQQLYGGTFEESGRKTRKKKQEDAMYLQLASEFNTQRVHAKSLALKNSKNAKSIVESFNRGELEIVEMKGEDDLIKFMDDNNIEGAERAEMLAGYRSGDTKAFIHDGRYIVEDADKAKEAIANGDIVQATAIMHEISHAFDSYTFTEAELSNYSEKLSEYMQSDKNLEALHESAVARLQRVGLWDSNKDFKDQSNKAKDEYSKYLLDLFMNPYNKKEFNIAKKAKSSLGNVFRGILGRDFKINSAADAISYLTSQIEGMSKGEIAKPIQRRMQERAHLHHLNRDKGLKESKDVTNTVDELARMGWDNKSWKEGGADFALTEMQLNKMLDGLIASKLKVPMSYDNTQEFIQKVYAELTTHVKNFKPEDNDSLFGWINSQISNKAAAVYNREYKVDAENRTVDIDATTTEGAPVVQIEADTDIMMDRIDNMDLSEKEVVQRSKLRRDIRLDKGMMDTVRRAVIKTFGTKLPNVESKKFKDALVKAFRTELKKPIQDLMGGRGDYNLFLRNHSEAIIKALPVETLVQMERNLKPEQRIFTESRRITKPTEVDKLIGDGKLPKDTNRTSGPLLHTKKPYPGIDKVMAYFRGENMLEELGYEVGASTLGTRKDKLAMELGVELALDATSEVLQDPDVQEKRRSILELQGMDQMPNDLALVAKQINRDPNIRFSKEAVSQVNEVVKRMQQSGANARAQYELEQKGIDKLLQAYGVDRTYKLDSQEDIDNYISEVENVLIPLFPKGFILPSLLRPSNRILPLKGKKVITVDGKETTVDDYFRKKIQETFDKDLNYGPDFDGDGKNFVARVYKSVFGNSNADFVKAKNNGVIDKFNRENSAMHRQMWQRIKDSIQDNKANAKIIGNFFKLTSQKANHPHRLGAEMIGWSPKPKGNGKKLYEWEHAMPATSAYLYLMDAALNNYDFNAAYDLVMDNYKLIALDAGMDAKLKAAGLTTSMPKGFNILNNLWWQRYFNEDVAEVDGGIDPNSIILINGKTLGQELDIKADGEPSIIKLTKGDLKRRQNSEKAIANRTSYSKNPKPKGMSTFDFDETLIIGGDNFVVATKGDQTVKITSEEWPIKGPEFAAEGYNFDFSDFVNVRGGTDGPLLQKMKNQIAKYGPDNVFVLTARMQDAATPIHEWLKSKGIDIPLKNITGLGKSEGEAKADWMLEKFAEGYNDMYFVDDAMPNVRAVKQVLDQLDIKSKVVQAKVKFSQEASDVFNQMLERTKGIRADKKFDRSEAALIGAKKGRFKFFVPPSAEDFKGLVYSFLGKGKQGDADLKWFKENLFDPYNKGMRDLNSVKQRMTEEYSSLKKAMPEVVSKLKDKVGNTQYDVDNALRVYLWQMNGIDIPGISDANKKLLVDHVANDNDLRAFAGALGSISRADAGYITPNEFWVTENIGVDLSKLANKVNRNKYLAEWKQNKDIVFSEENMNKIEAIYGSSFREALDNMLTRMETGSNRTTGSKDSVINGFLDWINGSVGAVMFFNTRSAVLQTISTVNFLNFDDNNIFTAAKAFANQKQFWSDFTMLFNSDMLKQRRAGLQIDVSASELTDAVAQGGGKARAVIKYLLEKGFLPTQIADSFAISMGGATFYRNRYNKYIKQGMSEADAKKQAFLDFQDIAEETQQSSRPDLISQQQAGVLGRVILAWQNTPMQMTRLTKKALSDLVNGRGDVKANISKIIYYGAVQNLIFGALQSALAFTMFGDEEEEEKRKKKELRVANGMIDTLLRGTGIYGAGIATLKNTIMKWKEEREKGFGKQDWSKVTQEMINLSPPIGSKVRKVMNAIKTYEYNDEVIEKMDAGIDNPAWSVFANVVEAATNIPLARIRNKLDNLDEAITGNHQIWQRVALSAGWDKWSLGIKDADIEEAKIKVKEDKERQKEIDKQKKKEARKNRKDGDDLDGDGKKEYRCTANTRGGQGPRCRNFTENTNKKCYAHQ